VEQDVPSRLSTRDHSHRRRPPLYYLEWGASDASPLLAASSRPAECSCLGRVRAGHGRHYRVVAPDARGWGDSQWSDAYSDDGFIEDIRALVTALGLKRPILCGNSMGGVLAYYYASLYPNGVDRLILVDTGPGEKPQRLERRSRQLVRGRAGLRRCPPAPSRAARTRPLVCRPSSATHS
jgi:pimeloyl-ACP methyl ester carboxylesterase